MRKVFIVIIVLLNSIALIARMNEKQTDSIDACKILKDIRNNLDIICYATKEIIKSEDECVLGITDSLKEFYLINNDEKFIIAIDSLCSNSDGYLAEYLFEVVPEIFYTNFKPLMNYLYKNRLSSIEEVMVFGLSMEVNMSDNEAQKKDEIENYVKNEISKQVYSKEEIYYINRTISKIDPNIWD